MDPAAFLDPAEVESNREKYDSMLRVLVPIAPAYVASVDFDPMDVPAEIRYLIPLARVFGIGDDIFREELVSATPRDTLLAVKRLVGDAEVTLEAWLLSPAATARVDAAYVAFTNLTLVADGVVDA